MNNIVVMHGRKASKRVAENALLHRQWKILPGKVEKVIGEVLVHKHLLSGNRVLDSPQVRAVGQFWLQRKGIIVLWFKQALHHELLLVGPRKIDCQTRELAGARTQLNLLGEVDEAILAILQHLLNNILTT